MHINPTIIRKNDWPSGDGKIILTFDDGPNPDNNISFRLLDVLYQNSVKATFCYIGQNMESSPEVVKRAISEGHSVAFHSHSHTPWPLISNDLLERELLESSSVLEKISGEESYTPTHFRTPWGVITPSITRTLTRFDLKIAHISFFVNDAWSGPTSFKQKMDAIKRHLIRNKGGAIVLHENCHSFFESLKVDKSWLPGAVEDLICWARENDFAFSQYGE